MNNSESNAGEHQMQFRRACIPPQGAVQSCGRDTALPIDMCDQYGLNGIGEHFLTGDGERHRVMEASTGFEPV